MSDRTKEILQTINRLQEGAKRIEEIYRAVRKKLEAYEEIGTTEECRKAVDKQKEMKWKKSEYRDVAQCPDCGTMYDGEVAGVYRFCPQCGKKVSE